MAFRLIHTTTLNLKLITGQSIPKYAILSHTWGDEEILYGEMMSMNGESSQSAALKSGYLKIQGMCEKARSLGFEYAWADTCCIDKSSSAELSEAINSMFQWYQRADICLVYLSDLSPDSDIDNDMPSCKWFTRGWCLQELIAPKDVRFYNNSWQHIGDKSTARLKGLISSITKIDQAVLSDATLLPTLSVAQKMSWASQRVTTRPEDIAYSLLGIFDINMPMLYGEGEKAFLRLQEEIIKRSNDLSIFAWGHPVSPSAQKNPSFRMDGIDDDENSFPTDPDSCCDLFARSPSDFSGCGGLVLHTSYTSWAFRNIEFSKTNNGLFFSHVDLRVSFNECCYLLPLLCYDQNSPGEILYLALKMVHAHLFVKLRKCSQAFWFIGNEKVDGYILTHLTPPTRSQVASSHIRSVQLCSTSLSKIQLYSSLLEISSRDTWDASRLAFLRCDGRTFHGHVKLNGRRLCKFWAGLRNPEWDFYLAWRTVREVERDTRKHRESLRVRLYSLEDWEGPDTIMGMHWGADSTKVSKHKTHKLRLAFLDVEVGVVSIEEQGMVFFRINIKLDSRG
jgi:hypothetical protein